MHPVPMSYLRSASQAHGGHFFDQDPKNIHASRIESDVAYMNPVTQDAFFVTSECQAPGTRRLYTIRRFDEECRVRKAMEQSFLDRDTAFDTAKQLAN